MEDEEVKKIYLYKFYVDGEEKKFKDPITVDVVFDKEIDHLIFSVEKDDLMFHTVANTIDEGLKDSMEILEEIWKLYALSELDNLSISAKKFGEYLRSLVEK